MKPYQIFSPSRGELTALASIMTFLLQRYGVSDIPGCHATCAQLGECLENPGSIQLLVCDVTNSGVIPILEQLRRSNPSMKLVLVADGTVPPVRYIRPSILPTALLWRPLEPESVRDVLKEVLDTLPKSGEDGAELSDTCFSVEVRGDVRRISYREILYFEASNKRLNLHTRRKEIPFQGTLEKLSEGLPGEFIRVHKSFIVNRIAIKQIQFGQNLIVLEGDITIPISRSYKPALKAVFV